MEGGIKALHGAMHYLFAITPDMEFGEIWNLCSVHDLHASGLS